MIHYQQVEMHQYLGNMNHLGQLSLLSLRGNTVLKNCPKIIIRSTASQL